MMRPEASDASMEGGKSQRVQFRHLQWLGRVSLVPEGLAKQRARRPQSFCLESKAKSLLMPC